MLVQVPESRGLPPTEGVVRHGHRNRDVHTDHADLDAGGKLAGCAAASGKDRHPVAVVVVVDELEGFVEAVGPHDGEHGPEDFLGVHRVVGADVVEEGGANEVAAT